MNVTPQTLEFRPSSKQRWTATLAVLGVCLTFAALFALVKGGLWGALLAVLFTALAVGGAWGVNQAMQRVRVGADARGLWYLDGTRRGYQNQYAAWAKVASCRMENRDPDVAPGPTHLVLQDAQGRDLFVLLATILSPADTSALLRHVQARLQAGGGIFDVPDTWL